METQINDNTDEYDREFINLIIGKINKNHITILLNQKNKIKSIKNSKIKDIEKKTPSLNKHDQLRVKNWCKKLCQITNNIEWKKNRNLHAICLLDSILNNKFEEPYNKFPKDGPIPIINKTLVKSKLSPKFFKESLEIQNQNIDNNDKVIEETELENRLNSNENISDDDINNNNNIDKDLEKNEIKELKELIERLKKEVVQRDEILNKLNIKKGKVEKNIFELENMLSGYLQTGE